MGLSMHVKWHLPARFRTAALRVAIVPVLAVPALLVPPGAKSDEGRTIALGRHLAQECTGCHRIDGVDNGIPSIIGWPAHEFVTTLKFYQEGARVNPVMVSVAKSLNEDQVKALALYYGSLPKPPAKGPVTEKKARK